MVMADEATTIDIIGLCPASDGRGDVCHRKASTLSAIGSEPATRNTFNHLNIDPASSTWFRRPTSSETWVLHTDATYATLMVKMLDPKDGKFRFCG